MVHIALVFADCCVRSRRNAYKTYVILIQASRAQSDEYIQIIIQSHGRNSMVYAQSNSVRNNAEVQRNLHKVSVRAKRQQQRVESIKTIGNYEIDFLISEFI